MNSFLSSLPIETFTSLIVMSGIMILSFVVYFKSKKVSAFDTPKGFLLVIETFVVAIEKLLLQNMGKQFSFYGSYFVTITLYIFIGFLFGLTGLASPLSYYMNTFTIVLISFVMIHYTALKTNGWKYFKRFIEPFPIFLPINLISVWAPLVSMSFRIFGNILSGIILMTLVYALMGSISTAIFSFLPPGFNSIFIAPFVTPWLHLYFDLFSAFIQTLVFISLSMLLIAQEGPSKPMEITSEENATA